MVVHRWRLGAPFLHVLISAALTCTVRHPFLLHCLHTFLYLMRLPWQCCGSLQENLARVCLCACVLMCVCVVLLLLLPAGEPGARRT